MIELKPCKCGAVPRLRYKMPLNWVECPKCHRKSKKVSDWYEVRDADSITEVVNDWNNRAERRIGWLRYLQQTKTEK